MSVFAGQPLADESIAVADHLDIAHYVRAHNRDFLNPGSPLYQCWQPGILKWLEDWQPQPLIVEANPRYRSTPDAVRWMHAHRRRVVGWGLGAPPLSGPLAAWRRLSRRSFLSALDGIIAYSQRGAEEYRLLGFSPQQVFVAPNAVVSRPERPGRLSPLDGIGPDELGLDRLEQRLDEGQVKEVILATNHTVEGEATAHYIGELARTRGLRATRIAYGVPVGGELEYTDRGTLARALAGRRDV